MAFFTEVKENVILSCWPSVGSRGNIILGHTVRVFAIMKVIANETWKVANNM